jgi:serine O-acetyltransferase
MSEALTMTATATAAPGLGHPREDLACVFQRDPAARSTFEVLTTYPGVHAMLSPTAFPSAVARGWRFRRASCPSSGGR